MPFIHEVVQVSKWSVVKQKENHQSVWQQSKSQLNTYKNVILVACWHFTTLYPSSLKKEKLGNLQKITLWQTFHIWINCVFYLCIFIVRHSVSIFYSVCVLLLFCLTGCWGDFPSWWQHQLSGFQSPFLARELSYWRFLGQRCEFF